jgi:hypothetical protein
MGVSTGRSVLWAGVLALAAGPGCAGVDGPEAPYGFLSMGIGKGDPGGPEGEPVASTGAPPTGPTVAMCRGSVEGPVVAAVTVPRGATCHLADLRVRGEVRILPGGILEGRGIWIGGDLVGEDAVLVTLMEESVVEGQVTAHRPARITLDSTEIAGGLHVEGTGYPIRISRSRVGGDTHLRGAQDIEIVQNRLDGHLLVEGGPGTLLLRGNEIRGTVQLEGYRGRIHAGDNRVRDGSTGRDRSPGPRAEEDAPPTHGDGTPGSRWGAPSLRAGGRGPSSGLSSAG